MNRSFSVLFKSPFLLIGLSCLVLISERTIRYLMNFSLIGEPLALLFVFIFAVLIQGVIIHCVYEALRGNPARLGKSIFVGIARFGPLMLVLILFMVLVVLLSFAAGVLLFIPFTLLVGFQAFIVAIVLGAILGLIAIVQMLKWSVFVPACVTERLGLLDSLQRSSELTKGFLLKIAVVKLLYLLSMSLFVFFIFRLMDYLPANFIRTHLGPTASLICNTASFLILIVVPFAFFYVVNTVAYFSLREAKDGIPTDNPEYELD